MGTYIFQGLAVGPTNCQKWPEAYEFLTHFISREQTERKSGRVGCVGVLLTMFT